MNRQDSAPMVISENEGLRVQRRGICPVGRLNRRWGREMYLVKCAKMACWEVKPEVGQRDVSSQVCQNGLLGG